MTALPEAILAVALMSLVILGTRAFPFLLFSRRKPPRALRFVERYIPPMVMAILVVYCLKDVRWGDGLAGAAELAALALAIGLHIWKKNAMLSIFGSTAFYMALQAILG